MYSGKSSLEGVCQTHPKITIRNPPIKKGATEQEAQKQVVWSIFYVVIYVFWWLFLHSVWSPYTIQHFCLITSIPTKPQCPFFMRQLMSLVHGWHNAVKARYFLEVRFGQIRKSKSIFGVFFA